MEQRTALNITKKLYRKIGEISMVLDMACIAEKDHGNVMGYAVIRKWIHILCTEVFELSQRLMLSD